MESLFYPAVFHKEPEGGFWVSFPDFPECFSQGEDTDEAYKMAMDALGLAIDSRIKEGEALPSPTEVFNIPLKKGETTAVLLFDMLSYRRKHDTRSVKKTLSIPQWLNEEAVAQGINFSKLLQEALMEKVL